MSVFSIKKPSCDSLPLIFDSPHSGRLYPDDFDYACDRLILERAEDHFVDDLFGGAPEYGGHLLLAHFPRSYVDVNRCFTDVDTELLEGEWQGDYDIAPSNRSVAGIGLIRRLVKPGIPVYNRNLTSQEICERIETYYRPYHNALADLIEEAHYNFGQVWHINCHSMPSSSAYPRRNISLLGHRQRASDFVIGDRDGTTSNPAFTRALKEHIKGLGYHVTINDPFKGVELVRKYSNPADGYNSVQIEVNKALYLNEETNEPNANYAALKADIDIIIAFIAEYARANLVNLAAD